MAGQQIKKAMEKVHDMDSLSDDSVQSHKRSYKRPRRSAPETMPGDGTSRPEQQV